MINPALTFRSFANAARPARAAAVTGFFAAFFLIVLPGCAVTMEQEQVLDLPPDARLVAVDVENFSGDVVVTRDPDLVDSAWIKSYLSVAISEGRESRAEYADAVRLRSTLEQPADGVVTLRIENSTAREGDEKHRARVEVVTPRLDGVRVLNSGGVVEVVDSRGAVEIRNEGGGVLLRTNRPLDRDVLVLNEGGDIYVQAPDGSEGRVILESLDGEASLNDPFDRFRGEMLVQKERIEGTLGFGVNEIQLRTTEGVVRLMLMEDPVAFTRMWKDHAPDPREFFGADSWRRHEQNLPESDVKPLERGGYGWDLWERERLMESRGKRSNVDR